MRLTHLTAAILLLALAAGGAGATPSTLIWIPSTDIQADGTWHLGLDTYAAPSSTLFDVGLTYGFAGGRAEVGLDYLADPYDTFTFNAKYLLLPETTDAPALAVGVYNLGTREDYTDWNMVYGLLSKTLGGARLTLGYTEGNEAALGVDPGMWLAGVDGYLSADKKWWGAVDYQSGRNAFGALSAGVAYALADNVSVILGYDWYNDGALEDTFTVQVDVNL